MTQVFPVPVQEAPLNLTQPFTVVCSKVSFAAAVLLQPTGHEAKLNAVIEPAGT